MISNANKKYVLNVNALLRVDRLKISCPARPGMEINLYIKDFTDEESGKVYRRYTVTDGFFMASVDDFGVGALIESGESDKIEDFFVLLRSKEFSETIKTLSKINNKIVIQLNAEGEIIDTVGVFKQSDAIRPDIEARVIDDVKEDIREAKFRMLTPYYLDLLSKTMSKNNKEVYFDMPVAHRNNKSFKWVRNIDDLRITVIIYSQIMV